MQKDFVHCKKMIASISVYLALFYHEGQITSFFILSNYLGNFFLKYNVPFPCWKAEF